MIATTELKQLRWYLGCSLRLVLVWVHVACSSLRQCCDLGTWALSWLASACALCWKEDGVVPCWHGAPGAEPCPCPGLSVPSWTLKAAGPAPCREMPGECCSSSQLSLSSKWTNVTGKCQWVGFQPSFLSGGKTKALIFSCPLTEAACWAPSCFKISCRYCSLILNSPLLETQAPPNSASGIRNLFGIWNVLMGL